MPLPKSLTSLLTAIVVAIPAAITTLALNKPKPPKEIDEVITLEENTEVIVEDEIEPDPAPAIPPPSQTKSSGSTSSGSLGGAKSSDDTESSNVVSESSEPDSSDDPKDPEDGEEDAEEGENEKQNQQENDDLSVEEEEEEEEEQTPPSPDQQGDKDITKEELQQSLIEVIKKIIEEGSNFNAQDSRLYKLYIIKTSLDSLPQLVTSLQTKIQEEEKNKSATEVSGVPGSPSTNGGQPK